LKGSRFVILERYKPVLSGSSNFLLTLPYREHIQPNGFKAMIVTSSRRAAVLYKQTLDELGAPPSECIISGDHNDEAFYTPYTDPTKQKQAIENFTKPASEQPLSFLVVKDMLLTGFDAPICQVMYLDRKLRERSSPRHGLIHQAASMVAFPGNRSSASTLG
jgi:type I site-specific restriction-modification system R (restriction) subunit